MMGLPVDLANTTDMAQSIKLRDAIKEYEANKWKVIGQKVGKPAKVSDTFEQSSYDPRLNPAGLRAIRERTLQEPLTIR